MGNTRRPAAKKAVAPLESVTESEEELSDELKQQLAFEQNQLDLATAQAQLQYLTGRVSELTKENYDLRKKVEGK